jgi:hypothetical protein
VKTGEVTAWPRLLDVHLAAAYLSIGECVLRDYVRGGVVKPVTLPGSALRQPGGRVVAGCRDRRMVKLLFDRLDLDLFVNRLKEES